MKLNNLKDFTRVVIIDDNFDEGNAIREMLLREGVSSAFFHIATGHPNPNGPYKNTRLVFLDLNLLHLGTTAFSAKQGAALALANLAKVVDKDSRYVLILWSNNTTKLIAKEFRGQLYRTPEIANPIKMIPLQKTKCKNISGSFSLIKLTKAIESALSKLPAYSVFSEGERVFSNAISGTITSISRRKSDLSLQKVVNSLAQTGTIVPKESVPETALLNFTGLLDDSIAKEIGDHDFGDLHSKLGNEDLDDSERAKLNSLLIFTPDKSLGSGAIYFIRKQRTLVEDLLSSSDQPIDWSAYGFMRCFLMDVTPLCGDAHSNGLRYFIFGIIHPKLRQVRSGKEINANRDFGYTFRKSFNHRGKVCNMSFNLKTYSNDCGELNLETVSEKVRPHIVMDVQHKVAAYVSRPGHALL